MWRTCKLKYLQPMLIRVKRYNKLYNNKQNMFLLKSFKLLISCDPDHATPVMVNTQLSRGAIALFCRELANLSKCLLIPHSKCRECKKLLMLCECITVCFVLRYFTAIALIFRLKSPPNFKSCSHFACWTRLFYCSFVAWDLF